MNTLPNKCPICGGDITVTQFHCSECESTTSGRFINRAFNHLSADQLDFIETFVRNEGKIRRMETELNLSYPTVRNKLHGIIRAMGFEPGIADEPPGLSDDERKKLLEDLDKGLIDIDEAMEQLKEN